MTDAARTKTPAQIQAAREELVRDVLATSGVLALSVGAGLQFGLGYGMMTYGAVGLGMMIFGSLRK